MSRKKATILCVDDHWNGLIGWKMVLEKRGYEVLLATGSSEGLSLFASHAIDAVVLDYQLPGMTGYAVAAKMKGIRSNVPIMLLASSEPLPQGKLEFVDSLMSKSQAPAALVSKLDNLLAGTKPFFHRWLEHWKSRNLTKVSDPSS